METPDDFERRRWRRPARDEVEAYLGLEFPSDHPAARIPDAVRHRDGGPRRPPPEAEGTGEDAPE